MFSAGIGIEESGKEIVGVLYVVHGRSRELQGCIAVYQLVVVNKVCATFVYHCS